MGFLHASAPSPVLCRVCGAAIRSSELRFGREEGEGTTRRTRWLHVACAAQNLPDALLRALELGGWQAVPKEDHYELRQLMVDARERGYGEVALGLTLPAGLRRASDDGSLFRPSWLRGLWDRSTPSTAHDPLALTERDADPRERGGAGSSSAAMIARLRGGGPEQQRMDPQLERAWVFADALQNHADPRGELLALSLALEHPGAPEQARMIQRDRHGLWRSLAAKLAGSLRASPALRLSWRGGFLVGARPRGGAEISGLLTSPAAASLTRIRVEFCTREELTRLVAGVREHRVPLARLDLPGSRLSDLMPLTELPQLRMLRMGDRFEAALLERLPGLRGLGLDGRVLPRARELAVGKRLELLELQGVSASELDGLARHLPHLRELSLTSTSASEGPRESLPVSNGFLAGAERLETLRLPDTPIRTLAELPALPRLRELILLPANLPLMRELGRLRGLERLALLGGKVGELDSLVALERLEHLALAATRVTELSPLRSLPRLSTLVLEGGDLRRMRGLPQLAGLTRLELRRLANVDLAPLIELPQLRALVLDPGGRKPRGLELLERMQALRELSLPQELLDELAPLASTLARIEVLELHGAERPPRTKLLADLPKLRRLILPGYDPAALASLADALPEVEIVGDPAPRDLLGLCDPFDWRAAAWPDDPRGAMSEHRG